MPSAYSHFVVTEETLGHQCNYLSELAVKLHSNKSPNGARMVKKNFDMMFEDFTHFHQRMLSFLKEGGIDHNKVIEEIQLLESLNDFHISHYTKELKKGRFSPLVRLSPGIIHRAYLNKKAKKLRGNAFLQAAKAYERISRKVKIENVHEEIQIGS